MENMQIMGLVIKEKRRELDLTQKELAEKLNVSDKAVSKWERSESLPDVTLIPLIAAALGVSIDYLMTGKTAGDSADKSGISWQEKQAREAAVKIAAETAQSKINVMYTIFVFVLLAALVCFWFVDSLFGGFIQLTRFIYVPVVYVFIVFAMYTIFAAAVRTRRTAFKATYGYDVKGGLNVVMAVVTAGIIVLMIYTYSSPAMRNDDGIIRLVLSRVNFPVSDRYSILYRGGYKVAVSAVVYFAAVALATALAKRDNAAGKNMVTATALCTVMAVVHYIYAVAQQVYIYYKKEFIYTVWLKTSPVQEMLHTVKTANIVYTVVIAAVALVFTIIIVKDKKQRKVQLIAVLALAAYLGVSAFGFIDTGYSGEGSYYAQFVTTSITTAFMFIPACPHLVMALNVLIHCSEKKTEI
ncbi:MAG: helix-turn-helix transcriptional regulator [Ruminococcaceae bacterium]|nr:helix-turn-helix transcriptional regulator [Oscillospiraceae bacterium]